jgi:serine/threonine protein kinase
MDYIPDGDLRQYLKNNYDKSDFRNKLNQLHSIIEGLKSIHEKGLIHRDFHSGNILNRKAFINNNVLCYITDLGLSRLISEADEEGKIYGQMTYIAPEVLTKKSYTPAADIYSLGIVAYEIFANASPYLNRDYDDVDFALKICQGLRPNLDKLKIPQLLKDLIVRC